DNLLPRKLRSIIFPMIESKPDKERIRGLLHGKKAEHLDYKERLRELLGHSNQWTTTWSKCCAIHTVALKKMDEFSEELKDLMYAPEQMVREMALWATLKVHDVLNENDARNIFGKGFVTNNNGDSLQNGIPSLSGSPWLSGVIDGKPIWSYSKKDYSLSGKRETKSLEIQLVDQEEMKDELNNMISLITSERYIPIVEKTNWFKSIDTFSGISENIISHLILSMDDLEFAKGEFVIRQGETGKSMYVIYSGEVEILTNGKVVSTEGSGHIFGERSVLVSEPREASVRTTQDSRMFCLEQEVLFMCFKENVELAKKLLAALFNELESHR
ncbi:cyclic nucleotide-binding domain-containing protein, partial [bacterium]|nr:cyclic nucleotide-binding domain-containing protein [bacterium]